MKSLGMTTGEQINVRTALAFLRARCGTWENVGKALHFKGVSVRNVAAGRKGVTPEMAFRVARFAKVGVDDVLAGKFPAPGTCPHCGHHADDRR